MLSSVTTGHRGILKASKRKFEILRPDGACSVIRFIDDPHHEYVVKDSDLRPASDDLEGGKS